MAMQMWIESSSSFSLSELREVLPRSVAVRDVNRMEKALERILAIADDPSPAEPFGLLMTVAQIARDTINRKDDE